MSAPAPGTAEHVAVLFIQRNEDSVHYVGKREGGRAKIALPIGLPSWFANAHSAADTKCGNVALQQKPDVCVATDASPLG